MGAEMTANDYYAIQEARASRAGMRRGAALAALPCVMLGGAIMLAVHLSIVMYSDHLHDKATIALRGELTSCRADVARYGEIAQLERDYANRRSE